MELEWNKLGFEYVPTNGFVRVDFAEGAWGPLRVETDPHISLHIAANCLHYGQAVFEGLKAFTTRDGDIGLFRPDMNAQRMAFSADRLCMEAPPEALFIEACKEAVRVNRDFVPPYGTGASLYIRPLLIGTEPMVGINSSHTYTFIVLVTPVGPYYKNGFAPVEAVVIEGYDRAAPNGTGQTKCAGNYAASLKPYYTAKGMGYPIVLFTDPREHKYVDEFGTSNFLGITPQGEYKTADSSSILGSITNDSLQVLARDMGLTVVKEQIALASLGQFSEVGACGTAAVITPIHAVNHGEQRYTFGESDKAGATLTALFQQLQGIQYGEIEDRHGWMTALDEQSVAMER
ncbi:MAG: branched-chain amino acid aminotransferase [Armatimonadota bacterium]